MKPYEGTFIFNPNLSEEEVKNQVESINQQIQKAGGNVAESEVTGTQQLAYPIGKQTTGIYVRFTFRAPTDSIVTIERQFKLNQHLLRHMITKAVEA